MSNLIDAIRERKEITEEKSTPQIIIENLEGVEEALKTILSGEYLLSKKGRADILKKVSESLDLFRYLSSSNGRE